jgi:shikimate dehydrogenase
MTQDSDTRLCAVIGNPIGHSRSPFIHSLFAQQAKLNLRYEKIEAPLMGFASTVATFFANGGAGLNVTVPFKEEAFALAQGRVDENARLAGAANTLLLRDGQIAGANTDGTGLLGDFERLRIDLADKNVLLVGAGGAARGIAFPLLDAGCAHLRIVNRNPRRAQSLSRHLCDTAPAIASRVSAGGLDEAQGQWDVVINATSSSLGGTAPELPGISYGPQSLAYDLVYSAQPTAFMRQAGALGAGTVADGLGMLVAQAAESFQLWHRYRPDIEPVLAALRQLLQTTRQ